MPKTINTIISTTGTPSNQRMSGDNMAHPSFLTCPPVEVVHSGLPPQRVGYAVPGGLTRYKDQTCAARKPVSIEGEAMLVPVKLEPALASTSCAHRIPAQEADYSTAVMHALHGRRLRYLWPHFSGKAFHGL
jgi:hypothetical protein